MQLRSKLTLSFLLVGILPLIALGVLATHNATKGLTKQAYQQLDSVRDLKARLVTEYFASTENHVATFATNYMVEYALEEFKTRFSKIISDNQLDANKIAVIRSANDTYYHNQFAQAYAKKNGGAKLEDDISPSKMSDAASALQYYYIVSNPNADRGELVRANDRSEYSAFHASIHTKFANFAKQFGYSDILLIDAEKGQVLYSVKKSIDLGTSLVDGPFSRSRLAEIFQRAKTAERGKVVLTDFDRYTPDLGEPASFVAAAVYDGNHISGVLVFHLPTAHLNDIMQMRTGLGETGESYLVGPDFLMRSDSYLVPQTHGVKASFNNPDQGRIDTPSVRKALAGASQSELTTSYHAGNVLASYAPINVGDLHWALVTEMADQEAFAPARQLKLLAAIIFFICTGGILGFALLFSRALVKPLVSAIRIADRIAKGQFDNRIPPPEPDETGQLLTALEYMQNELRSNIANTQKTADAALRIKVALDNMSGMVTVTNTVGDITYMNEAMRTFIEALLGRNRDDIKHLNDLAPSLGTLIGARSHARLTIDTRTVDLVVNNVMNDQHQHLGYTIEWTDITEQLVAEQQVQELIEHAAEGKLDSRLTTETLSGFMRRLAEGINALLGAVSTPVKETQRLWHQLALGDLSMVMQGSYAGEFATLRTESTNFVDRLRVLVTEIRTTSEGVHAASTDVAESNLALNTRTEDLKTSLADTAVSVTQITTAVRETASRAEKAKRLTHKARTQAENGLGVMDQTVAAMQALQEASDRIADIIGVMDTIAFQTNLLALNASVEAARAGEHGRGFAVVATEVRHLAQKSAESGKEIKALVDDAVFKTQGGTHLVNQSRQAFNEIVQTVKEVSDLISDIAVATSNQTSRIVEINQSMAHIDKGAHHNVAIVQAIEAAIERLGGYSQHMQTLLQFFTQTETTRHTSATAAPVKPRIARTR